MGMPVLKPGDDVWVQTACDMCYCACGVRVHRVNGVVVRVEGDPDCPYNRGRLCAKGQAALMSLYDPNRLLVPLKRTNPRKGIGVDPGWVEVTWEEALDAIARRLREVRARDPSRLLTGTWDHGTQHTFLQPWAVAFGSPNDHWSCSSYFCGNAMHQMTFLTNGTFHSEIDLAYCNYAILFGNQHGFMVGVNPNLNSQLMAEARMRGMKLVVIDPVCTPAASKADEWVPIRPGTDAALALAMLNVLVNELALYDAEFLRLRTNGAYLVGPQGRYLRDQATGRPTVWDKARQRAVAYTEASDAALEGSYRVQGVEARTSFQLLKEHLRQYPPEEVSPVTTVPAGTIRRLARDYAQAACIGATIALEGQKVPYRPAAVNAYRGANAHKHGAHHARAVQLLNLIVGNIYAVGGHRGVNLIGPSRQWMPGESDGLISPPPGLLVGAHPYNRECRPPETIDMNDYFPVGHLFDPAAQLNMLHPGKYKAPTEVEVLILCRTSPLLNRVNLADNAFPFEHIPFFVYFTQYADEQADFADFLLPDTHVFERWDVFPQSMEICVSPGTGYWFWGLRQPIVEPRGQARDWKGVLVELAERIGFLPEYYETINVNARLKEPHRLEPGRKYSLREIQDRLCQSLLGPGQGLSWLQEHGYSTRRRTTEEIYPGSFIAARYPIYYEHYLSGGEKVAALTSELGLTWDTSDYQALPEWKPCPAFTPDPSGHDLYAVNYKTPVHFQSWTVENAWLSEVGERHPYYYKVMINTAAAAARGIVDGELLEVSSSAGKVKGVAKVTECIHPEVVGIAGGFGAWSTGRPIAKGKGMKFNRLLPFGEDRLDMVSCVVDSCVRVKVEKAAPGARTGAAG